MQSEETYTDEDRLKELRDVLKSIEKIHSDVSELRELLSEKYAESIADNVTNCITQ